MGRHLKTIESDEGIDRRETGYYSTPEFVADFITEAMLNINPNGRTVLDPAVGKEELLKKFFNAGKHIDSFDICDYGPKQFSSFTKMDFLEFYRQQYERAILDTPVNLEYDYYIANPPYNCHENEYIKEHKSLLIKLFSEIGALNMYSMFLSAMISCAKPNALIGVITLDSFLTAKMHYGLRKQILQECAVHHLILCPTDLFWDQNADVRTCILILQKGKINQGQVKISPRPANAMELKRFLSENNFKTCSIDEITLSGSSDFDEFLMDCPNSIRAMFQNPRLGESFRCVTGISTGDDAKYLSETKDKEHTIPFYKNPGMRRFYTEPDAYLVNNFLDIEKSVKNFMVRNKDILFKEGITCSSMGVAFGAAYLPAESTYGVNANIICDPKDIWWLLGYLNSSLVTYLVRACLIRSNMITSGYVSRIPLLDFTSQTKKDLEKIALEAHDKKVEKMNSQEYINRIDNIVFGVLNCSAEDKDAVMSFTSSLLKSV